ncbi:MAG: acetylornithine deacetylase [Pseudomonadota bacterium]
MTLSLDILDRLIAFETVGERSNLDMIAYIENFLSSRQFRTHRIPDLTENKTGLYAEIGPSSEGGILLSAHSDVVSTEGQNWTKPPFRLTREGEMLFGRGTTDMKGFLAEMLALAERASRKDLKAPLKLLISYDEEIGCVGIARMKERLGPLLGRPRLAIVGEPTEMQVAIGHKGKRAYQANVVGQAGHSALAPKFVSALELAVDFIIELRRLQDELKQTGAHDSDYDIPYSTIHVGKILSGTALNIVPDSAELLFEFRHLAKDNPDQLEQKIRQAAHSVGEKRDSDAAITLDTIASYPGLATPKESAAVAAVQTWAGTPTCKVAFGTEAGFLTELDIPTVVCGPGSMSRQGHKADEHIAISDLSACSKMLSNALDTLT